MIYDKWSKYIAYLQERLSIFHPSYDNVWPPHSAIVGQTETNIPGSLRLDLKYNWISLNSPRHPHSASGVQC